MRKLNKGMISLALITLLGLSFACAGGFEDSAQIVVTAVVTATPEVAAATQVETTETRTVTATSTELPLWGNTVFEDDFSNVDFNSPYSWQVAIDGSVGCEEFPVTGEDISAKIVKMDGENVVLIQINPNKVGGLFANGIVHRSFKFTDASQYRLTGSFMFPMGIYSGEEYQDGVLFGDEVLNAAFEFVVDGTGHSAELLYGLNPYVEDTLGVIYTRYQNEGGELVNKELFNLGVDANWHQFEIVISIDTGIDRYTIESVAVDGESKIVGVEMPAFEKNWDSSSQIYLETHNLYPSCDASKISRGASMWKNLQLEVRPLQ